MTKKEILKMWEKYHEICSLYRGKPLSSLFEYESIPFHSETDEIKAIRERNREIAKKNAEIEEIIYILENEHKIANIIQNLEETFGFSRKDIEENIGFYDPLFTLPWSEIYDKVTFFIELLGSKENFFSAMRIGTPNTRVDELSDLYGKGFWVLCIIKEYISLKTSWILLQIHCHYQKMLRLKSLCQIVDIFTILRRRQKRLSINGLCFWM